ncbi:MAG: hypothetical protein SX243_22770 [Acidobacteriota bacterium]|nr:hypothetical protein [Acidobacteriota bacterium]
MEPEQEKPWFAQARFHRFLGVPITWQGWVSVAAYFAVLVGLQIFFDPDEHSAIYAVTILAATVVLAYIFISRSEPLI